jgi:protein SCO1
MASWVLALQRILNIKKHNNAPQFAMRRLTHSFAALTLASGMCGSPAMGHGEKSHPSAPAPTGALTTNNPAPPADATSPLPFNFGGPFELIDHNGEIRSDKDFRGKFMLVFFGYVQCQSLCPIALQRAALALDSLDADEAAQIQPLAITIDPENDTPDALKHHVKTIHPRLIGLTGDKNQVKAAAAAYGVDTRLIGAAPNGAPVYAHGSFLFLMGPDGIFVTLLPPTLGEAAMANILKKYLRKIPG